MKALDLLGILNFMLQVAASVAVSTNKYFNILDSRRPTVLL